MILQEILSEFFKGNVTVETVTQRSIAGIKVDVANIKYHLNVPDGENEYSRKTIRETVALFTDEQLHLPEFTLTPQPKGFMQKLSQSFFNQEPVGFEDTPKFASEYRVHGFVEVATRILISRNVREFFQSRPGWSVRGKKNRLLVFQHKHVVRSQLLERYVDACVKIFSLFQSAENELDIRPEVRRDALPTDFSATDQPRGGLLGGIAQRQIRQLAISRRDLDAFLKSKSPREIPKTMKHQLLGDTGLMLLFGPIFSMLGLLGGLMFYFFGPGNFYWLGLVGAIGMPVIAMGVSVYALSYRKKKLRVLREGIVSQGRVTGVERTGKVVSEKTLYDVSVSFENASRPSSAIYQCQDLAATQARSFQESESLLTVLVDPENSKHIICTDLLSIIED